MLLSVSTGHTVSECPSTRICPGLFCPRWNVSRRCLPNSADSTNSASAMSCVRVTSRSTSRLICSGEPLGDSHSTNSWIRAMISFCFRFAQRKHGCIAAIPAQRASDMLYLMQPEQAEFLLRSVMIPSLQNEHGITKRVMAAVPDDKGNYKPDPNSMTAFELVRHIAGAEIACLRTVTEGQFSGPAHMPESVKTVSDVVKWYEEN